jgi:hypothetical protein
MQATRIILATSVLLTAWLAAAQDQVKDPKDSKQVAPTNSAPRMRVNVEHQGGPGQISCTRVYLTAGAEKFAFLVPEGFGIDTSAPDKVTLSHVGVGNVSVQFVGTGAEETKETQLAVYRQSLAREYPGLKIREEFSLTAAGQAGPAFDLSWLSSGGLQRSARVAFIPLKTGLVEFSLQSNPGNFEQALTHLHFVMLTFRASDKQGKLEATPLSQNL